MLDMITEQRPSNATEATASINAKIIEMVELKAGTTEMSTADIVTFTLNRASMFGVTPQQTQATEQTTQEAASTPEYKGVRMPGNPAVPVEESVGEDYIISLETGEKFTMLKRHLRDSFGMTEKEYKAKWNLPADYPMSPPNYRRMKSEAAKRSKLGKHKRASQDA